MNTSNHSSLVSKMILYTLLLISFCAICAINFSAVPIFYDADMYCDYRYAMEAWEHKSIFPDGWVFGNQLNAVSTPVLAALIFGFADSMNFSMAAACTIMAVLVVLCYDWMIKTVIQDLESRLVAICLFVTVTLYCGAAIEGNEGWTLFFTMCSYYAGYSITAFLAFGCYVRGLSSSLKKYHVLTVLCCILSFGTGIQSIRQTAIMSIPILSLEFLRMIVSFRSWRENREPLWIALGIAVSNFLGLCYVRMCEINQHQVFGTIKLTSLADLRSSIENCSLMIQDLLRLGYPAANWLQSIMGIVCITSLFLIVRNVWNTKNFTSLFLGLLMAISVLVIVGINIFTTMYVRPRYYFMLYPLISFSIAYVYAQSQRMIKRFLLVFVALFFCIACAHELPEVLSSCRAPEDDSYEISAYLLENGYTTIYSTWWCGQDIAIASDGQINVGYWYTEDRPFEAITHLCSLDIYNADPDKCVYYFEGKSAMETGLYAAENMGVAMELLSYYPESDVYIYTAPSNLMRMGA